MINLLYYFLAAIAEIIGCFTFWAWLRLGKTVFWILPGMVFLIFFAWLLTHIQLSTSGKTYAVYGGIYIIISLIWLWVIEATPPDQWDFIGAGLYLIGASIILFTPR